MININNLQTKNINLLKLVQDNLKLRKWKHTIVN